MNVPDVPETTRESLGASAMGAATFLSRGVRWGLLVGAVVGGVGGRLAMLVLRVTSDAELHGVRTDDDFKIGRLTLATLFLVALTALLGVFGGLVYLLVRDWLPRRWRAVVFGVLCATVVGSTIISADGIDFRVLSPLSLAVAMFVLIPGVYGAVVSVLIERSLRLGRVRPGGWRWLAVLPLGLVLLAGPFVLLALVVFAVVLFANRSGRVAELWRCAPMLWVGRCAVSIAFLVSGAALVQDVGEVL